MGVVLFLGGASGGVVLGAVSDSVYRGQRTPPLLIFTAAQARAYSQLPSSHS
jgi:sugar phosphate permease